MKAKSIKEKVKAKAKAVKEKLKGKGGKCAVLIAALCAATLCGCMDTNPASRQNSNRFGDVEPAVKVVIGENAVSNVVTVTVRTTIGDGVLASADSSGSTETQTATPTLDVRTRVDARYNDALAAASATSRGILETLMAESANKVLAMMASGGTGTVEVTKTDGTNAVVECKDGQCEVCKDCAP